MNAHDWKSKLLADLKRDKKRSALLVILVLIALGVVARLSLKGESPAPVAAASLVAPQGNRQAGLSASDGGAHVLTTERQASARSGAVAPVAVDVELATSRDLFRPNPDYFPVQTAVESAKQPAATTEPSAGDPEADRQTVRAQAKSLQVQSTVVSAAATTAIINDRVVRAGDWVNGFRIVSISQRAVTVEKNGFAVTLEMPQ